MPFSHPPSKSDPAAWRRFALQLSALLAGVTVWLAWTGRIGAPAAGGCLAAIAAVAGLGWRFPRAIRGPYEVSMRVSLWLGDRVGPLVLGVCYFVLLTPLGLLLRIGGYDPLGLRRNAAATSSWRKADAPGSLDRMF